MYASRCCAKSRLAFAESINANAKCEECGNTIDDIDLAELGQKRFDKILCVQDYLKAQRG